jgi:hypothetical protein
VKKVSEQLLQDPFTARMAEKYGSQPDSTLAKYAGDIRALQGDYTAPVSDDDMRRMQMQSMIVNLGNIAGRGFHNKFAGPYLQAENPYAPQLASASKANMAAKANWREGQQKSKMATLDLFAKNAMQRDREKSNLAKVMELFGTSPDTKSKPETGHLSGGGRTNLESARAPQSATSSALPSVPAVPMPGIVIENAAPPQSSQPATATGLPPSDAPPASSVAPTQDVTTPSPVGQPTPQQVFKSLPRLAQARVMEAARGDVGKAVDLAYDMWRQQQGDQRENQKMSLNERKFAHDVRQDMTAPQREAEIARAKENAKADVEAVKKEADREKNARALMANFEKLGRLPTQYGQTQGSFGTKYAALGQSPFSRTIGAYDTQTFNPLAAWTRDGDDTANPLILLNDVFRGIQSGIADDGIFDRHAVRSRLEGGIKSMGQVLKKLSVAPGERWTDQDQVMLEQAIGDLRTSSSPEDYKLRLQDIYDRIRRVYDIPLPETLNIPDGSQEKPVEIRSRAEMESMPPGVWVKLPDGRVVQRKR